MPDKANVNDNSSKSNIVSLNSSNTPIQPKSELNLNARDQKLATLQKMADNSPYSQRFAHFTSLANNSIPQQPVSQLSKDSHGLPDNLKQGVESLSGISMDDVKVHYNSDKPAQLNAHAYAQGTDIHIASGQEKHLPHEAWHVVQQKQGRVQPTTMMKAKVFINDDKGLEKEADVMGARALQMTNTTIPTQLKEKGTNSIQTAQLRIQNVTDKTWLFDHGVYNENGIKKGKIDKSKVFQVDDSETKSFTDKPYKEYVLIINANEAILFEGAGNFENEEKLYVSKKCLSGETDDKDNIRLDEQLKNDTDPEDANGALEVKKSVEMGFLKYENGEVEIEILGRIIKLKKDDNVENIISGDLPEETFEPELGNVDFEIYFPFAPGVSAFGGIQIKPILKFIIGGGNYQIEKNIPKLTINNAGVKGKFELEAKLIGGISAGFWEIFALEAGLKGGLEGKATVSGGLDGSADFRNKINGLGLNLSAEAELSAVGSAFIRGKLGFFQAIQELSLANIPLAKFDYKRKLDLDRSTKGDLKPTVIDFLKITSWDEQIYEKIHEYGRLIDGYDSTPLHEHNEDESNYQQLDTSTKRQ
jgi:hypothetical protein